MLHMASRNAATNKSDQDPRFQDIYTYTITSPKSNDRGVFYSAKSILQGIVQHADPKARVSVSQDSGRHCVVIDGTSVDRWFLEGHLNKTALSDPAITYNIETSIFSPLEEVVRLRKKVGELATDLNTTQSSLAASEAIGDRLQDQVQTLEDEKLGDLAALENLANMLGVDANQVVDQPTVAQGTALLRDLVSDPYHSLKVHAKEVAAATGDARTLSSLQDVAQVLELAASHYHTVEQEAKMFGREEVLDDLRFTFGVEADTLDELVDAVKQQTPSLDPAHQAQIQQAQEDERTAKKLLGRKVAENHQLNQELAIVKKQRDGALNELEESRSYQRQDQKLQENLERVKEQRDAAVLELQKPLAGQEQTDAIAYLQEHLGLEETTLEGITQTITAAIRFRDSKVNGALTIVYDIADLVGVQRPDASTSNDSDELRGWVQNLETKISGYISASSTPSETSELNNRDFDRFIQNLEKKIGHTIKGGTRKAKLRHLPDEVYTFVKAEREYLNFLHSIDERLLTVYPDLTGTTAKGRVTTGIFRYLADLTDVQQVCVDGLNNFRRSLSLAEIQDADLNFHGGISQGIKDQFRSTFEAIREYTNGLQEVSDKAREFLGDFVESNYNYMEIFEATVHYLGEYERIAGDATGDASEIALQCLTLANTIGEPFGITALTPQEVMTPDYKEIILPHLELVYNTIRNVYLDQHSQLENLESHLRALAEQLGHDHPTPQSQEPTPDPLAELTASTIGYTIGVWSDAKIRKVLIPHLESLEIPSDKKIRGRAPVYKYESLEPHLESIVELLVKEECDRPVAVGILKDYCTAHSNESFDTSSWQDDRLVSARDLAVALRVGTSASYNYLKDLPVADHQVAYKVKAPGLPLYNWGGALKERVMARVITDKEIRLPQGTLIEQPQEATIPELLEYILQNIDQRAAQPPTQPHSSTPITPSGQTTEDLLIAAYKMNAQRPSREITQAFADITQDQLQGLNILAQGELSYILNKFNRVTLAQLTRTRPDTIESIDQLQDLVRENAVEFDQTQHYQDHFASYEMARAARPKYTKFKVDQDTPQATVKRQILDTIKEFEARKKEHDQQQEVSQAVLEKIVELRREYHSATTTLAEKFTHIHQSCHAPLRSMIYSVQEPDRYRVSVYLLPDTRQGIGPGSLEIIGTFRDILAKYGRREDPLSFEHVDNTLRIDVNYSSRDVMGTHPSQATAQIILNEFPNTLLGHLGVQFRPTIIGEVETHE